jgi:hypothetical protein
MDLSPLTPHLQVEYRVLMQQQSTGASLKTDLLIQRPFLRTQTMETLTALADQMWLHVFVEGSAVVTLGEEGGSLFLVKTGHCDVLMNDAMLRGVIGEYEARRMWPQLNERVWSPFGGEGKRGLRPILCADHDHAR